MRRTCCSARGRASSGCQFSSLSRAGSGLRPVRLRNVTCPGSIGRYRATCQPMVDPFFLGRQGKAGDQSTLFIFARQMGRQPFGWGTGLVSDCRPMEDGRSRGQTSRHPRSFCCRPGLGRRGRSRTIQSTTSRRGGFRTASGWFSRVTRQGTDFVSMWNLPRTASRGRLVQKE